MECGMGAFSWFFWSVVLLASVLALLWMALSARPRPALPSAFMFTTGFLTSAAAQGCALLLALRVSAVLEENPHVQISPVLAFGALGFLAFVTQEAVRSTVVLHCDRHVRSAGATLLGVPDWARWSGFGAWLVFHVAAVVGAVVFNDLPGPGEGLQPYLGIVMAMMVSVTFLIAVDLATSFLYRLKDEGFGSRIRYLLVFGFVSSLLQTAALVAHGNAYGMAIFLLFASIGAYRDVRKRRRSRA
jgi:hypothetical protein